MDRSPRFFQEIDPSIVRRCQRGEIEGFKELYLFYGKPVRHLGLYLLGDMEEANDLLHDLFLKAYEKIKDYRFEAPFAAWFYRIAVNLCRDRLRARKRRNKHFSIWPDRDLALSASDADPSNDPSANEQEKAVRAALMQVPDRYRVCLILREIEDCSYEEIAAILKVSLGTVRSRLSRGRDYLRKLLLEHRE
ncbi:MAG: RNA polymerase sigma factor [Candidatus Binatia bacterium]